jgi:phenol hydroxylase P0 protein
MAHHAFDTTLKFVRIIGVKDNGMVEFEFSVGDPDLFVELLLPAHAFADFCAVNQVTTLDPQPRGGASGDKGMSLSLHDVRASFQ